MKRILKILKYLLFPIMISAVAAGVTPPAVIVTASQNSNTANPVVVSVTAPALVASQSNFAVSINITNVTNLNAANFNVTFNPAVLRLDSVTDGNINGTAFPAAIFNPLTDTVVQYMPGLNYVTGSGTMAVLHFSVPGSTGQTSNITLTDGVLSNTDANEIPASWTGATVTVTGGVTVTPVSPPITAFAAQGLPSVPSPVFTVPPVTIPATSPNPVPTTPASPKPASGPALTKEPVTAPLPATSSVSQSSDGGPDSGIIIVIGIVVIAVGAGIWIFIRRRSI